MKNPKKKNLTKYVGRYIRAKIKMTLCKQKHFKQVCHNCKAYANCHVYGKYVDAWIKLQKAYKRERKNE